MSIQFERRLRALEEKMLQRKGVAVFTCLYGADSEEAKAEHIAAHPEDAKAALYVAVMDFSHLWKA